MNVVKKILCLPPLINFGLGVGLIVGAYIFEIFGYYDPCPLCILQRWSFALIAICGLIMAIPGLHKFLKNEAHGWVRVDGEVHLEALFKGSVGLLLSLDGGTHAEKLNLVF